MRLVILESPYSGDIDANIDYARRAMADSLARDEAPFASHLLYTQPGILDDENGSERFKGIHAGLLWGKHAEATVVYADHGISEGMNQGIMNAKLVDRPVEIRYLDAIP